MAIRETVTPGEVAGVKGGHEGRGGGLLVLVGVEAAMAALVDLAAQCTPRAPQRSCTPSPCQQLASLSRSGLV